MGKLRDKGGQMKEIYVMDFATVGIPCLACGRTVEGTEADALAGKIHICTDCFLARLDTKKDMKIRFKGTPPIPRKKAIAILKLIKDVRTAVQQMEKRYIG